MRRFRFNPAWTLFLLLLILGINAHASILSTNFELSPTAPTPNDEVQVILTIVLPVPCFTVEFSEPTSGDRTFRALVDITPPAEGTPCIEVLGKFSHTYTLGRLLPATYRFRLNACERDPIEGLCIIHPAGEFEFAVFAPDDVIPAGVDAFAVESTATQFAFMDEFTLPVGFFDVDSRPFRKVVRFSTLLVRSEAHLPQSHPIATLANIRRIEPVGFDPKNTSTQSVPIELVNLFLRSTAPIAVLVQNRTQLWDVFVELSLHRASAGRMTLTKRNKFGGTLSFDLSVFPLFRFVRQSDGLERVLDTGALQLSANRLQKLTLKVDRVPWLHQCLALGQDFNARFCPGATLRGVQRIRAQSTLFKLGLRFAPLPLFSHGLDKYNISATDRITHARVEIFTLAGEMIFSEIATELSLAGFWEKFANGVYLLKTTRYDLNQKVMSEVRKFVVMR